MTDEITTTAKPVVVYVERPTGLLPATLAPTTALPLSGNAVAPKHQGGPLGALQRLVILLLLGLCALIILAPASGLDLLMRKAGDLLLIVFVGGLLVAALGLAAGIVRDL